MALMSDRCQSNGSDYPSLVKINVSCYMMKLDFWVPLALLLKTISRLPVWIQLRRRWYCWHRWRSVSKKFRSSNDVVKELLLCDNIKSL